MNAPDTRETHTRPDADTLRDRAVGAYLGLAIGDALGATVEFMTPREILEHHGVHKEIIGGGWLKLPAGVVTDDTTMSLALGEAILAYSGRVLPHACAEAFDAWMRDKPVDIGNTVRRNLLTWRRTGNAVAPESEHDAGNGAAMRLLPVALATFGKDADAVAAANRAQAHVTHNNPLSDAACEALIGLIHAGLANCPAMAGAALQRLLSRYPVFSPPDRAVDNPSGYIVHTVHAVIQCLTHQDEFESALIDVVNRGGDADTTGAIVGMIMGARVGAAGIPRRWRDALDPDTRRACTLQAARLLAWASIN
jgi:ADP-ribosyl-[dinitrogen reductase] hydrolase